MKKNYHDQYALDFSLFSLNELIMTVSGDECEKKFDDTKTINFVFSYII